MVASRNIISRTIILHMPEYLSIAVIHTWNLNGKTTTSLNGSTRSLGIPCNTYYCRYNNTICGSVTSSLTSYESSVWNNDDGTHSWHIIYWYTQDIRMNTYNWLSLIMYHISHLLLPIQVRIQCEMWIHWKKQVWISILWYFVIGSFICVHIM